ncbi:MAG TPA: hypothetical protein VK656_02180, partial [Candidatus Acidoferrum sp.]|nr:hypothetical protein [Candidatus Acidoferrum sp.]
PLVPLLGIRKRWLALAIAALSSVVYPLFYADLWRLEPALTVVLDVRNGLLVVFLAWLCVELARRGVTRSEDERHPVSTTQDVLQG